MNERFQLLWTDYLEGELDEAGMSELESMMEADPALAEQACDYYQEHRLLNWLHKESPENCEAFVEATLQQLPGDEEFADKIVARLPRRKKVSRIRWIAPALGLGLAAVLVVIFLLPDTKSEGPPVARLILAEDCEWQPGSEKLKEGQDLTAGPLALKNGSAVIRFTGGTELVLSGDTRLDLIAGDLGRLVHGEVVVRADDGAEGFKLITPTSEFEDLGTEFAVKVTTSGETRLDVYEGKVASESEIVTAGHGLVFDPAGPAGGRRAKTPADAPRFIEMVRRANPRERRDQMLAYEGFFVEEGVYSLPKMNGGKGWSGPWRQLQGEELRSYTNTESDSVMHVSHSRMTTPWPVRGGKLGALELSSGKHVLLRDLADPIDMHADGHTFVSFMVSDGSPAELRKRFNMAVTLRASKRFYAGKLGFAFSSSRQPVVRTGGSSITRSTRAMPRGETLFCVGRITRSREGADEISFRCYSANDDLHFVEPADWDVEGHRVDLSFELDVLEVTSDCGAPLWLDELRIGPTWRSVTPLDRQNQ